MVDLKFFIDRHLSEIRARGIKELLRKSYRGLILLFLFILLAPVLLFIRLIRPWFLVRWLALTSNRIGHLAEDTERYLCKREFGLDNPKRKHIDLFFMSSEIICNKQLAIMWKRVLPIIPFWILSPLNRLNLLLPGGNIHKINPYTHGYRDIHNLFEKTKPHLKFTEEEELKGIDLLKQLGITPTDLFVCILVRDDAYLPGESWSYHNYRNSNIHNFMLAAEELANLGYFVLRMGAKVKEKMISTHPKIIDYANHSIRSEFMDIYLGAKCYFAISTGAGWDSIPLIFRKPIVYVNLCPIGHLSTTQRNFINLTKHHVLKSSQKKLTLSEIFSHDLANCLTSKQYESKDIELIENTPEEIRDAAIEMHERLNGTWVEQSNDEMLQKKFWEIYPVDATDENGIRLHGNILSRYSTLFLRNNQDWLER
ncbi:TIGR04372 family glycosyltransferase [Silvanigrella sp.]|uniref:TIGR04372 family glycosyltransferase n=1 Tax=Silvanigrella sp. TaxID=2024976 RepID=UPI0037C8FF4E